MTGYNIITVNSDNVEEFGFFCVKNKKHRDYIAKLKWLHHRFKAFNISTSRENQIEIDIYKKACDQ